MLKPFVFAATAAIVSQFLPHALAASLHITIPSSALLPNPNTLPASTHAVLTSGSGPPQNALLRKDNTLVFPDIPTTGTHLLQIYSRDYTFAPYRIDISSTGSDPSTSSSSTSISSTLISGAYETYPGTQWSDHGIALLSSSSPVSTFTLYPKILARRSFYEDKPGFNPLNLVKQNPMILLGGVALLFTIGLPKLMENMDPEMRAEYEEMQKNSPMAKIGQVMQGGGAPQSGAAAGPQGFDLAGYLAKAGSSNSGSTTSKTGATTGREGGADSLRERRR